MTDMDLDMEEMMTKFIANIDSFMAMFAYQGFNPEVIRNAILASPSGRTDLATLLGVYIVKGTNLTKIINTTKAPFKIELMRLKKYYRIMDNVPKTGNKQTVTTLARIAAAFPAETTDLPKSTKVQCHS